MKQFIKGVQCSNILSNRMQCIRPATWFQDRNVDPEDKHALCGICYALTNKPQGYTFVLPEEAGITDNPVNGEHDNSTSKQNKGKN